MDTVQDPPADDLKVNSKSDPVPELDDKTAPGVPAMPPPVPVASPSASRTDMFAVRGVRSPLVGRETELDSMVAVVEQAIDFHAPQLITVLGNQGTGKSRLVTELINRVAKAPTRVFWARAPVERTRYGAITKYLRERFDINSGEPRERVEERFKNEIERVFGDRRTSEVLHFLGEYIDLSFPSSPFVQVLGENPVQHDEISRTVLRRFVELGREKVACHHRV